jgi:hypothetical protein
MGDLGVVFAYMIGVCALLSAGSASAPTRMPVRDNGLNGGYGPSHRRLEAFEWKGPPEHRLKMGL